MTFRISFVLSAAILAACHRGSSSTTSSGPSPSPSASAPMLNASTALTPAPNTLTEAEKKAGWKLLFDGKTTAGWRGYKMQTMPPEWMVMDGTLMKMQHAEDIVTTRAYTNFELSIDWKLTLGSNSGIFIRGTEEYERVYWSAIEYQLAEDSLTPDSKNPLTAVAAVYGFYPTKRGVNHRAGEWNTTKIVANGSHVEHWLNGVLIASYDAWSPEFTAKYEASKFHRYFVDKKITPENFAKAKTGLIAIQGDHPGELSLRNIKIRELK
ncbi:MAG TPA: DUF1080 domain-containing protein [Gemmatimonadaceae bacterium]|nr:DUF1080 domain-containing protein [Gemmatimonadaceae bacterium]